MFDPMLDPVRLFARAGASRDLDPHSLEAFRLGLRLGATGVQGDVWQTADREVVFGNDGYVGSRFRRRSISDADLSDLGDSVLAVADLYDELGAETEVMVTVRDPDTCDGIVAVAVRAGALERLWIMSDSVDVLRRASDTAAAVRLVHFVRLADLPRGPEPHAAQLRQYGIEAVCLPFADWTAGHVAMFHRFGRVAIAWEPQHERQMVAMFEMGIDGLISTHVDRMVDARSDSGIIGR